MTKKIRKKMVKELIGSKKGMYLPVILMASVVFIAFATAIISLALINVKVANQHVKTITSMSIAEAGINYYLWHLAHNNLDYCDGNTCPSQNADGSYGPFTHTYKDQSGNALGTYDLFITPPNVGSSITTVKSIGKVDGKSPTRTVISQLGMPSFSKYTLLANNSEIWVGSGEKVNGSIFVNHSGIKNDGEVTKDVFSTESTYHSNMFNQDLPGINGGGVFGGAKSFPVPPVDFNQLDVDIKKLRDDAKNLGKGDWYGSSGKNGYHLVLGSNNYELRRVVQYDNDTYDITSENVLGTHDYPSGGVIFLTDNVWVEGRVDNKKVTIVAADPEANTNKRKQIIIPNNITYTHKDGSDKIGLITQTNITVSHNAPDYLEIDAAMIAKDGYISICPEIVGSNKCPAHQAGYTRKKITVYGSMAHNTGLIWTVEWGNGVLSGYEQTEIDLDPSNILNPPPKFPLTGTYAILSWREE